MPTPESELPLEAAGSALAAPEFSMLCFTCVWKPELGVVTTFGVAVTRGVATGFGAATTFGIAASCCVLAGAGAELEGGAAGAGLPILARGGADVAGTIINGGVTTGLWTTGAVAARPDAGGVVAAGN